MAILDKPLTEIKPKLKPQIWTSMKHDYVLQALMQCNGSCTKTGRLLGITRQQVWNYKKNLGL